MRASATVIITTGTLRIAPLMRDSFRRTPVVHGDRTGNRRGGLPRKEEDRMKALISAGTALLRRHENTSRRGREHCRDHRARDVAKEREGLLGWFTTPSPVRAPTPEAWRAPRGERRPITRAPRRCTTRGRSKARAAALSFDSWRRVSLLPLRRHLGQEEVGPRRSTPTSCPREASPTTISPRST